MRSVPTWHCEKQTQESLSEMGLTAIEAADRAAADRYLSAALDRFAEIVSDHPSIEWIERTQGAIGIPHDGN